jgi:esterase/lipase
MVSNYSDLFLDPKLDYPQLNQQLSFSDYIEQCKALIKKTRLDLQTHAEQIISANSPFELRPKNPAPKKNQFGALLIHGLLDCPFTMRDIGVELQSEGLLVRTVLLPGHGTIPGALLHIDYNQWVETVRFGVDSLAKEVEHVFLIGFSTGGALALYHAANYPKKIAGIILLSPALKINCPLDFLSKWPPTFSKIWPQAAWFHQDRQETMDYARYLSTPFNAVYEVYRLTQEIKKMNPPACPIFFILGASDLTVLSKASIRYFLGNQNSKNRMIIYHKKNVRLYKDNRIILRPAYYEDKSIYDFSHLSIPISPYNSHYGENGDYEAYNIDNKFILYGEHYIPLMNFHNFLFKLKLARYQYQRLTFNPDFSFMSEQIKQFISNASKDVM